VPINVEALLAARPPAWEWSWGEDQVILYHLSIGAGASFTDPKELEYVYERDLKVLPTFAVVPSYRAPAMLFDDPIYGVDLLMVVLGENDLVIHDAIPTAARVVTRPRITDVYDRGSGALILSEHATFSLDDGRPLFTNISSLFVRGHGGFGGRSGPTLEIERPARPADVSAELPILPQQSQLYRVLGAKNVLLIDPQAARRAGFDKPIMYGHCTYGMICKAAVDLMLDGDVSRIGRFRARFAQPVHPGETILLSAWREGGRIIIDAHSQERGTPAVKNCLIDLK
jgi:acyl dehydratase